MSNPQAFPCKTRESFQQAAMRKPQQVNNINPQPIVREEINHPGMTLRDYFAAHAPKPSVDWHGGARKVGDLIEWRWRYADAMLKAREA